MRTVCMLCVIQQTVFLVFYVHHKRDYVHCLLNYISWLDAFVKMFHMDV
jgi:hypothetical protein